MLFCLRFATVHQSYITCFLIYSVLISGHLASIGWQLHGVWTMTSSRYQPLSGEDQTGLDVEPVSVSGLRKYRSRYILALFMVILGFAVGFSCGELLQDNSLLAKVTRLHSAQCTTPAVRREWRSMGIEERHDYITAVQCLMSTPSKLRPDGTLYEDFAYVHSRIGSYCE